MTDQTTFDFPGFKDAFEHKNAAQWLSYFAENAEWTEYRQWSPPSNPNRMIGRMDISHFLDAIVAEKDLRLSITDEVLSDSRIAFRVTCSFPDGRQIIENVICDICNGKITHQVDVEAWDEGLH